MRPLLSIIVPVFNVEKYLRICVDSILSSSFCNYELLLIDDGSLDSSGRICDEYSLIDSRVRVFHKKNAGVSSARNYGLMVALGQWVTFIDSDDFISPIFFDGLIAPVLKNESIDFVHGGCTNWENDKIASINQSYDDYVGTDPAFIFNKFRGLIVSKLFRLDLIRDSESQSSVFFDEKMVVAEDMVFTLDYIVKVNEYAFVPEVGYYYRRDNASSATHRIGKETYSRNYHSAVHAYNSVMNYINSKNLSDAEALFRLQQRGDSFFYSILSLYKGSAEFKERVHRLKTDFPDEYLRVISMANGGMTNKVLCNLLVHKHYYLFDGITSILFSIKSLYEKTTNKNR